MLTAIVHFPTPGCCIKVAHFSVDKKFVIAIDNILSILCYVIYV